MESQANYQVLTNPVAFLVEARDPEGMFADMPTSDRAEFIDEAEKKIISLGKQDKALEQKALIDNRKTILDDIVNGVIDLTEEPELIRNTAGVDIPLANAMRSIALNSGKVKFKGGKQRLESSQAFGKIAKDIFNSGTEKQISDFTVNALKDPKIDDNDLKTLIYLSNKKAEELAGGDSNGYWSNFPSMLASYFLPGGPVLGLQNLAMNVLTRVAKEKANEARTDQITQEEVQKARQIDTPDIRTFGEKGQIMVDEDGNKARVFPDGRIEEID